MTDGFLRRVTTVVSSPTSYATTCLPGVAGMGGSCEHDIG